MYDTKTMTPFGGPSFEGCSMAVMTPEIPDTESNSSCSVGTRTSELGTEAGADTDA